MEKSGVIDEIIMILGHQNEKIQRKKKKLSTLPHKSPSNS